MAQLIEILLQSDCISVDVREKFDFVLNCLGCSNPPNDSAGIRNRNLNNARGQPHRSADDLLYVAAECTWRCEELSLNDLERYSLLAEAWVRFALACIELYVPDKPQD